MTSDTKTVHASCLCGTAKHEITLPVSVFPLRSGHCHCNSCRRMTGALCLTNVDTVPDYKPAKELLDKLVPFQFSKRITQYHCKTCGSQMISHYWNDGDDHSKGSGWDIQSGTLEKADGVFELQYHIFIADTLDGGFSDFLPSVNGKDITRWEHDKNKSEQLPLYWQSPDRPQIKPSPSDKLHCHCKCNGVNFWIARPSKRSKKAAGGWPDLIIPHHSNQPRPDHSEWWLRENGTKFLAGNCSCNSCRLDTGMEWISWAFIPTIDISLDAEGKTPFSLPFGTLQSYNSSPGVTRYFCGTCGATVYFTSEDRADLVDVAVGLLDAREGARAESWLGWRTERLSFREDAMPRAEGLTLGVENGLKEFRNRQQK